MSALDWLMQQLGGEQQVSGTSPQGLLGAAFDKMTGPAADQAYWDWQRERYGASPPDQGGRDPQVGSGLPSGAGDRGIYTGPPIAFPQRAQPDAPSAVNPPPGAGWPTLPRWMDKSLPRDFTFDDQPFRDTLYSRQKNPPNNPWDMLRVSPLNQMFPQYADPWAMFPEEAIPAALKARRRIPGLY